MELDKEGFPIIPEDLKNKPQSEWTPEDWQRSGGSGTAQHDYSLDLLGASILPQTRVLAGAINTTKSAIDIGKKVWNSPIAKPVRDSDFVQNWMKDPNQAGNLQKTINAEKIIDDILAIPSNTMMKMQRVVKESSLTGKDLADNFNTIIELFNQEATVNLNDKLLDTSTWNIPEGYKVPRNETILGKTHIEKQRFWKNFPAGDKLKVTDAITRLDNYVQDGLEGKNYSGWKANRPTRGFRDGSRTFIAEDKREYGLRWTNNGYAIFDVAKNKKNVMSRYYADKPADDAWSNLTRSARLKIIKDKNRNALEALERIKDTNPNLYLDIVGNVDDHSTVWTVEHIHSRDSGQWIEQADGRLKHKFKVKKDGSAVYFGDSENLMPATGTNYGRLKTNIERHLKNSEYFVDINPKSRNFVITRRSDGKPVSFRDDGKIVEIHGMTPAGRWKNIVDHVMGGGDEIGLVDTNPEVPTDIALEQPGIIGKEPNTRVDPLSSNPEPWRGNVTDFITKAIEDNLEGADRENALYWKEIIDDHLSGVEVLPRRTYKRYLKKYGKLEAKAIQLAIPGLK